MVDITAPPPGRSRIDLVSWISGWARTATDDLVVHLQPRALYWTESFRPTGWSNVTIEGHGARLITKNPPPSRTPSAIREWNRCVELVNCTNVTINDVEVIGPAPTRPLATSSYDSAWEGQHAFSITNCRDVTLNRVKGHHVYGDGVYISTRSSGVTVSGGRFYQIGRNGCSTVAATDVWLQDIDFTDNMRTTLNLEVHEGQVVEGYVAQNIKVGWHGLGVISSTGEGDTRRAAFDGLSCGPGRPFLAEIRGPDPGPGRDYGNRVDITLANISGGEPHRGRDYYVKLLNIDGLTIVNVPYPMRTTGSTPGRVL